jgi:hypothetical protein
VNGKAHSVTAAPDTPLLYILRNDIALNGAKFGCGLGQCGACTVVVGGAAVRSCRVKASDVDGAEIHTIEGLGTVRDPHRLQRAFMAEQAAQCGYCINPNGLELQIEGGVIQGTSWTLHEAVSFDRQRITSRDWASYPILTFSEVPKVEVVLLDRPDEKSMGAGEASQGPAAAAIANAFAHATGRRIRDLPLRPERVKAVLGAT